MTVEIAPTRDLDTCLALRHAVFVVEQNVPVEREQDNQDDDAHHILAWLDGVPVGTARILIKGEIAKIGRVCVLPSARGRGLGAALIRASLAHLETMPGVRRVVLGAQTHALRSTSA